MQMAGQVYAITRHWSSLQIELLWRQSCHVAAIKLQGWVLMNEDQHRRRTALWLGSFPVIAAFALLILILLLINRTQPSTPQIPARSSPPHQTDQYDESARSTLEPTQAAYP